MSFKLNAFILVLLGAGALAQTDARLELFNKYFEDKTLRIDFFHVGNAKDEDFTIDHIYKYGIWAGSRIHLIDNFNNGRYYAKIYDEQSGTLIYSKGYDCFFGEYKSSAQAIAGQKRTYHESVLIPAPKSTVKMVMERRDKLNELQAVFSKNIDPNDISIIQREFKDPSVEITTAYQSVDAHGGLDIVILAEGYNAKEKEKYADDLKRFTNIILDHDPYKAMNKQINVYGVYKPSIDSGVDEPRAGIYKNTVLSATFNSLGSERYLMTEDNKTMRDLAAHVPYDAIYIMVNHERYGGGGIYNLFCTFTTDNQWYAYLFLHEFGHSFAGLADEYYTSSVAYNDFYPKNVEPVEPNITALINPESVKWQQLLSAGIDVPTLWEKADYDTMDLAWQKKRRKMNDRIAQLKREKAPKDHIQKAEQEYVLADRAHADKVDAYLQKSMYAGKVGAFEGAGYSAQGLYRPMLDCIMFSKGDKPFCRVCDEAIRQVIMHYTE